MHVGAKTRRVCADCSPSPKLAAKMRDSKTNFVGNLDGVRGPNLLAHHQNQRVVLVLMSRYNFASRNSCVLRFGQAEIDRCGSEIRDRHVRMIGHVVRGSKLEFDAAPCLG